LDAIRRLADHVIARHYPEAVDAANRYRTLLDLVISRQAALIAKWQLLGFIHANVERYQKARLDRRQRHCRAGQTRQCEVRHGGRLHQSCAARWLK
jgi:hypothetical protein